MKNLFLILSLFICFYNLNAQSIINPYFSFPEELQDKKNIFCKQIDTISKNLYQVFYSDTTPNNRGDFSCYIFNNTFNNQLKRINDSIFYYSKSIDNISNNQFCFLIDKNGNLIRKIVASDIRCENSNFLDRRDLRRTNFFVYGKYFPYHRLGMLDSKGKDFLSPIYRDIIELNSQCFALQKNDYTWVVINKNKKIIIPKGFVKFIPLNEKYFIAAKKWTFNIDDSYHSITKYTLDTEFYLVTTEGKILTNSKFYQELDEFQDPSYHALDYYKEWLLKEKISFN